jgi:16S rRNA (cytosine967-C5)-methyltransferase
MTPAARVQAAIELLDLIIASARSSGASADRIIAEWFRTRRFAGSKDRKAVRELTYAAIRACGEIPRTGRAAMLRVAQMDSSLCDLFDGSSHGPMPIAPGEPVAEGGYVPAWLERLLADSEIAGDELPALLDRAPLDCRINMLKQGLANLPEPGERTLATHGLRFPTGTRVEQWDAYLAGAIEIQDTASQLVCEAVGACPGENVVDLCAGAGGKTLALAAAMDNRGSLLACDIDRRRLSRLRPRAERAGAAMIETRLLDPGKEAGQLADWSGRADAVLVDAPCSGTGTWRRNPEARWRLDARELERLSRVQSHVLDVAAGLVKPGGRLLYAVCSVLDPEGAGKVEDFLNARPGWSVKPLNSPAGSQRGAGMRLTPFREGTDGFFFACLVSPC